jgi:diguanylate cyclase (GGDEF)-like protein
MKSEPSATRPGRPQEILFPPEPEKTRVAESLKGVVRRFLSVALEHLERLPRVLVLVISLLLVGLIALASYATQVDLRFSFFYLLPIALSSWFVGRSAGIFLSFTSTVSWTVEYLLEHRLQPASKPAAYDNAPLLLGSFLILSLLLSTLHRTLAKEKDAARVDPLTRIANRRAFFELAEAEIRRAVRYGGCLTAAYVDLDDFKAVNDQYGHEAGDRVLCLVAQTIRGNLRVNDIAARLGGDEFIILLPQTGATDADAALGKIRSQIEDSLRTGKWPVTVSTGCVTFERPPDSVDQMVRLADELMYFVKASGKNRVAKRVIGAQDIPSGL